MNFHHIMNTLEGREGQDITVYTVDGRSSTFSLDYVAPTDFIPPLNHNVVSVTGVIRGTVQGEQSEYSLSIASEHVTMISLPRVSKVDREGG